MIKINRNLIYFLISLLSFGFCLGQNALRTDSLTVIGPIINDLPLLDTLLVSSLDSTKFLKKSTLIIQEPANTYPMSTSGTFYRNIEFGSMETGGVGGGLRMQLSGMLSENIQVSGVVTDQSIPIQPDGTTAKLEELDEVYLNISHPNGNIIAGDIFISKQNRTYNNSKKNIIGLKNTIKFNNLSSQTTYGQSRGKYNRLEFKGEDGRQGPYFLTSKQGERNIIISAGTESIWLNNKKLNRGEDQDYTIDYSLSEIYFTPKNLIFFDSDIDIEYQYSESAYKTNYFETSIARANSKANYNITFTNESDDLSQAFLNTDDKEILASGNELYLSGVVPDSLGDYELIDNIFYYRPSRFNLPKRYSVTFSPSAVGRYARKISNNNRIYYEHTADPSSGINNQTYAPGRVLNSPEDIKLIQINSEFSIGSSTIVTAEGALSLMNKNLFSKKSDKNLQGDALQFELRQKPFKIGSSTADVALIYWQKSFSFQSMGREREVNFNQSWDLNYDNIKDNEYFTSLSSNVALNNSLKTNFNYSTFRQGAELKQKSELNLNYVSNFVKKANIRWSAIDSRNDFHELDVNIQLSKGLLTPFFRYSFEKRKNSYQFNDAMTGLDWTNNNNNISIGYGAREDKIFNLKLNLLEKNKIAHIYQLDFKSFSRSGWKNKFMFRRRINNQPTNQNLNNFSSFRASLSFRDPSKPFNFNLVGNRQNTLNQSRVVVYDSIGVGMGSYRYDPILNEYIEDRNGAFLAQTILTGSFIGGSRVDGLARINVDFSKSKIKKLEDLKYRFIGKLDFQAKRYNGINSLKNNETQFYQHNIINEIILQNKSKSNRYRGWIKNQINFNGMDARGWENRAQNELAFELKTLLKANSFLVAQSDMHEVKILSENKKVQNRTIMGAYSKIGLKEFLPKIMQLDYHIAYYIDYIITERLEKQNVNAYGLESSLVYFLKKNGRLEGRLNYFKANGYDQMPPEALQGLSDGKTFRLNMQSSFLLGGSLSVSSSMSYVNNNRYKNFFTMRAEIRANF